MVPSARDCRRLAGSRARFQARIDMASFLSFDHNPCFGLCRVARWNQLWVRVAGMYLH